MVSLELKNVSLKRNGKWLLQSVDWLVNKQEHWVLYGLNGAENRFIKYALLLLFPHVRRDDSAGTCLWQGSSW